MADRKQVGGVLGGLGQLGSSADLYRMPRANYGQPQQQQQQPQQAPTNPTAPSKGMFEQLLDIIMNRKNQGWWNNPQDPNIFRQTPSNPIGPTTTPQNMGGQGVPLGGYNMNNNPWKPNSGMILD